MQRLNFAAYKGPVESTSGSWTLIHGIREAANGGTRKSRGC